MNLHIAENGEKRRSVNKGPFGGTGCLDEIGRSEPNGQPSNNRRAREDGVETMQFSEGPELKIQAEGPTLGAAFAEAALAMIGLVTDPAAIRLEETIEIDCDAPSAEQLLVKWLDAVVYEMKARGMIFGVFKVDTDGFQLHAEASGEHVPQERQGPAIRLKGATLKGLAVSEDLEDEWRVECTVDFDRA